VRHWPAVAFLRPIVFDEPAEELAQRIRGAIARQEQPELADVRVIRSADDIDEARMPVFLRSFFRWAFR
jgi:hypothetical protein